MPLKQYTVNFKQLSSSQNIRLWLPFALPEINCGYDKLTNFLSMYESGSRPPGGISGEDIGEAISLGGEQINVSGETDLTNTPYVSFDFFNKSTKGKVIDSDILVCKDGALTGKSCFADISVFPTRDVMVNEHIYILRSNEKIDQKLLFYLISSDLFKSQVKDLAYRKKAQPGLNSDHLKRIKIPFIPVPKQKHILAEINEIETRINKLKSMVLPLEKTLNNVFSREFDFVLEDVNAIDDNKLFHQELSKICRRNFNLRFGYRWNQLERVQKILYSHNNHLVKLGKYIKSTKNGWSPECNDDEGGRAILGIDAIQKTGKLKFNNPKFTNKTRARVDDFIIQENDFFVSRGNTTDLVAMASIADLGKVEREFIYPDLMIRVELDEERIDKRYLAFLFNSIIGRIYFKYSAKGKNQSMVKISAKELYDFYIPLPKIELQHEIIDEIESDIKKQEIIVQQIASERSKIYEIIELEIKGQL